MAAIRILKRFLRPLIDFALVQRFWFLTERFSIQRQGLSVLSPPVSSETVHRNFLENLVECLTVYSGYPVRIRQRVMIRFHWYSAAWKEPADSD